MTKGGNTSSIDVMYSIPTAYIKIPTTALVNRVNDDTLIKMLVITARNKLIPAEKFNKKINKH